MGFGSCHRSVEEEQDEEEEEVVVVVVVEENQALPRTAVEVPASSTVMKEGMGVNLKEVEEAASVAWRKGYWVRRSAAGVQPHEVLPRQEADELPWAEVEQEANAGTMAEEWNELDKERREMRSLSSWALVGSVLVVSAAVGAAGEDANSAWGRRWSW